MPRTQQWQLQEDTLLCQDFTHHIDDSVPRDHELGVLSLGPSHAVLHYITTY